MLCEHLRQLEQAILARGIREVFRGRPWSKNCRTWVYLDCWLDLDAIRATCDLAPCIQDHVHRGTHDGQERGLYCSQCHDAIMGAFERIPGLTVFAG